MISVPDFPVTGGSDFFCKYHVVPRKVIEDLPVPTAFEEVSCHVQQCRCFRSGIGVESPIQTQRLPVFHHLRAARRRHRRDEQHDGELSRSHRAEPHHWNDDLFGHQQYLHGLASGGNPSLRLQADARVVVRHFRGVLAGVHLHPCFLDRRHRLRCQQHVRRHVRRCLSSHVRGGDAARETNEVLPVHHDRQPVLPGDHDLLRRQDCRQGLLGPDAHQLRGRRRSVVERGIPQGPAAGEVAGILPGRHLDCRRFRRRGVLLRPADEGREAGLPGN